MKVVDHEPHCWFFLEEDGAFFLDGHYSHSFIGYDWMIQLTHDEAAQYRARGRDFISWLAGEIQSSAPLLKVSTSIYKDRRVPREVADKSVEAIERWKTHDSLSRKA